MLFFIMFEASHEPSERSEYSPRVSDEANFQMLVKAKTPEAALESARAALKEAHDQKEDWTTGMGEVSVRVVIRLPQLKDGQASLLHYEWQRDNEHGRGGIFLYGGADVFLVGPHGPVAEKALPEGDPVPKEPFLVFRELPKQA